MSKPLVLVVDDEPFLTHAVSMSLNRAGYEAVTADDGEQGYRLACERRPDLIVTDYQMPVLSGPDMCQRLARTPGTAAVPVVMLTARGHRIGPSELAGTGVRLLMPKPFSARELVAKVRELIGPGIPASGPAGAAA